MLRIVLGESELFDEGSSTLITLPRRVVRLEHSLRSVSKWEARYHRAFLTGDKSDDEILDYIQMMEMDEPTEDFVWRLSEREIEQIKNYISDSHTATTITGDPPPSRAIVTSELIYYWMTAFNIPFECQDWPLNRLITLVRVCEIKSQDPKKNRMRMNDVYQQNAELNAARKKKYGTRG